MNEKQQLPQEPSDHDRLIRVDERTDRIDKWCTNHAEHHFRSAIMAWSATIGLLIALILALLRG
jgi:hypothetical protein